MQRIAQKPGRGVVEGDTGFVAGSFDSEDEHGTRIGTEEFASVAQPFPRCKLLILCLVFGNTRPRIPAPMPIVRVKENEPFDVALRRFKRAVEKTGLLTELRAREFYEKPTAERKRKHAAAVKRRYKRMRAQMLPPKLY